MTNLPIDWGSIDGGAELHELRRSENTEIRNLAGVIERGMDATRGAFINVESAFPAGPQHLLQTLHTADNGASDLTLTTSFQDVTGLSIGPLPFTADYLFLSVFMFSVTAAGVITCEGRMKVGS